MLELAHAWHQTNELLQHSRRQIEELPARIASESAKIASGDGYSHLHAQNVARAQRDLAAAKAVVPELEKQTSDLKQQYHELGYDDATYTAWSTGETPIGGRGIEEVGDAVANGGSAPGIKPTGDEDYVFVAAGIAKGLANAAATIVQLGKAALSRAALRKAAIRSAGALPKEFDPAEGFATFQDFKDAFGAAGPGHAWHHNVEQTINSGKFAAEILHNPGNLFKLPHGKGSIHAKLSGHYSSKQPFTEGLTVREWLSKKSFKDQFEYGIRKIKEFGGAQYLPQHLR
jgi:hypothetical protein